MSEYECLTIVEYKEFKRRMDEENKRQDERIRILENALKNLADLIKSVDRLATNMENMATEQKNQGKRLETLEAKDGMMWRKVVSYSITAIVGILIGVIFKQLGL